jgi:hypothetical protein
MDWALEKQMEDEELPNSSQVDLEDSTQVNLDNTPQVGTSTPS